MHTPITLALVACLSAPPHPAQDALERWDEAVEAGRAVVSALHKLTGAPGLTVAVAVDGEVVWTEGFGDACRQPLMAAGPNTRYRVGSVSKLITVTALARLVQRGALELDSPVQRYVPSFPEKEHPISLRQLAGHLAGIRHYEGKDFTPVSIDSIHFATLGDGLAIFAEDPLLHEPGTAYRYSSFGYNLIGVALEGAAGKPFLELVQEEVLEPLSMESTCADQVDEEIPRRSSPFDRQGTDVVPSAPIDPSYKWPSGGFLSTAADLARLGVAFQDDSFLSEEMREVCLLPQTIADGSTTGVGLGWRIAEDTAGRRFAHHGGSIAGGRAFLLVYPNDGVVVAFACNLGRAPYAREEPLLVAEGFLGVHAAATYAEPEEEASGLWQFTAPGRAASQGTLWIERSNEAWTGELQVAGDAPAPVVDVRTAGGELRLVFSSPQQRALIVVRMRSNPEGQPSGTMEVLGRPPVALEFERKH